LGEKEEPVKGESQTSSGLPLVTSYDSGYEHSLEHWLDVQQLVREVESEFPPFALAANRP
jgi:hypothetical protein